VSADQHWYTTAEVAELLGRSDRYVRDRVKRGELEASVHKGARRDSYKISKEALLTFMILGRREGGEKLLEIVRSMDGEYLARLHELLGEEMTRRNADVEIIHKCKEGLKPLMELENRRYNTTFTLADEGMYRYFLKNKTHFTSGALNRKTGLLEGHLSVGVTTVEFYDLMRRSKIRDDKQAQWSPEELPVLYINSFILEDPIWAVFLFKDMAKQLKSFAQENGIRYRDAFAVAAVGEAETMLARYGFETVALYEDKYPLMVNRDVTKGRLGRYLR